MNDQEFNKLNSLVEQSALSRESYVRMILNGLQPVPPPSEELVEILSLLRNIANNINQIAKVANTTGDINEEDYINNHESLIKVIDDIKTQIRSPIKVNDYGNN